MFLQICLIMVKCDKNRSFFIELLKPAKIQTLIRNDVIDMWRMLRQTIADCCIIHHTPNSFPVVDLL